MWLQTQWLATRGKRVLEIARWPSPGREILRNRPPRAVLAFGLALVLAFASIATPGAADPAAAPQEDAGPMHLVPILLTGAPSPGIAGGVVLQRLGAPLINAGGDVACTGIVKTGKEKVECLWVGRPGDLRLAATSEGKEMPFRPNDRFYLADNRYAVFLSSRNNFTKVFGFGSDGLHRCPAGPFHGWVNFQVTPDGVAIIGETGEAGLVCWRAGSDPSTLVHLGDPAPGMPGTGIVFAGFPQGGLCAAGSYVMFWAYLEGPGIEQMGQNPSGVWLHGPSGLALVTAVGIQPADGFPPAGRGARPLDVDATGRIALQENAGSGGKVWIGQLGNMKPVLDASPDTPVWLLSDGRAVYASREKCLVVGNGIDKGAILVPAENATFGRDFSITTQMSVSPSGNVAWVGPDAQGGRSLFVCVGGRLRTLLRPGQSVEVGPGDVRVISRNRGISLARDLLPTSACSQTEWRTFTSINDRGDVAVTLQFDAELGVRDRSEGVVLLQVP
jgi:hypothetical protein